MFRKEKWLSLRYGLIMAFFVIWYLIFEIPNTIPQKVFGKVFKYPQINMYLVFYLNTSFSVFDPTLDLEEVPGDPVEGGPREAWMVVSRDRMLLSCNKQALAQQMQMSSLLIRLRRPQMCCDPILILLLR